MMKALIIIDVQKAMFGTNHPVYQHESVLKNIKSLIDQARRSNALLIYVQHNEDNTEFQSGCESWEIMDEIRPMNDESIIQKAYPVSFYQTNLESILIENKINELIIVGMQTEYCINATSMNAYHKGYRATVVSDAHSTFDEDSSALSIIAYYQKKWKLYFNLEKTHNITFL